MRNKLTIGISGRSFTQCTIAKMIYCDYINRVCGHNRLAIEKQSKKVIIHDTLRNVILENVDMPHEISADAKMFGETYSAKIYSVDDAIKNMCASLFGLTPEQVYPNEANSHNGTHVSWDDLPKEIRKKHSRENEKTGTKSKPTGCINTKDLIEIFKNDFCLATDTCSVSRSIYDLIEKEKFNLAIIKDIQSISDVTLGTEHGHKIIRLVQDDDKSDDEIKDLPEGEFSLVIRNKSSTEAFRVIKGHLDIWYKERGMLNVKI